MQNLTALRFGNALFEPLWKAEHIDHVQITVAETVGLERRASYYDKSGALRDMVQNHMLQLLCLVAMEPPPSLAADAIRDEKLKVLRSLRPIEDGDGLATSPCAASTAPARSRAGAVPGYLEELGSKRLAHRDLRRAQGRSATTGAGPACRSTCARASAWPNACRRSW